MRHTFASHMVMRRKPLKSVREILGHASITTTMRYAHFSPDHFEQVLRLNPLGFVDTL